ncbi:MAG TPA: AzlD domain-containing protein, partial [Spirochaetota bacterium]|nr:AzlD domain-containing protein [Spirochaetota bacterium]
VNKTVLIILTTAVANYSLRVIPFFISRGKDLPPYLKRFLEYLPIAALGALIFPGVINSFQQNPAAGIAGVTAAAITAWLTENLIYSVTASIAVTWYILQYI